MIPETTDLQTSSPSTSSPIDTRNPVADPTDPNQLMFAQTENNLISGADQEDEAEEANELLSWNKKTEDEIFGNIEKKQFKKAAKNLEYAARFFYNSASAAKLVVKLAEKNPNGVAAAFLDDRMFARSAANIFKQNDKGIKGIHQAAANILVEMFDKNPKKMLGIFNFLNGESMAGILKKMTPRKTAEILLRDEISTMYVAVILSEMMDDENKNKILKEINDLKPEKGTEISEYLEALKKKKDDSEAEENNTFSDLMNKYFSEAKGILQDDKIGYAPKMQMLVTLAEKNFEVLLGIFIGDGLSLRAAAEIFAEDDAIIPIAAKVLGEMGKTQPKKAAQILNRMSICGNQKMIVNILRAMNLDKATLANIFMDDAMGFEEVAQIFLEGDTIVPIVAKVLDEMGKTQPKKAAQILNRMSICDKQEMIANIFTGMNLKIVVGILTKNEISNKQILGILCKMYDLNDASHVANILAEIFNKNPKKAARILNAMDSNAAAMVLGEIASDVAAQFLASDRMTSENVAEILGQMCASGQQSKVANILAETFNKDPKKAARILHKMNDENRNVILTKPDMNPCVEEIRRTLDQWSSDDDPDDLGDAVFRILNALKDKNFSGASAILWDGEMSLDDILSKLQSEKRTELLELLLNDEVNYGDMKGILSHFNEDSYGTAAKALAKINESQPEKGVKILVGMIANEEYVVAAGILDKMSEQISINILANDELEVEELFIIISSMKNWEQTSAILGKIYAMEKHRAKVVKILSFFEASDLDKFLATELLAPHAEDIRQAIEGEELGTLSEDEMSKEGEMKKIVDDATKEKVDAAAVPFAGWAPIILVGLGCGVLGALASFLAIFFIPTLVTMWSVVVCVNLGCAIAASAGIAFYQSRAKNSKNTQDDPTAIA
ncbi:MAG: hypothetical protein LBI69_03085 [Puniceicoccales bacterium]|jgi:hypothetical protein|nr:hypothetical protein [Puniceicoccales bacterium]